MPVAQFSGLASGIDSKSLIDAIIKARETTNEIRKADIDHLQSENDSLNELNTKILALNDLIDQFRTANGGGVKKKATSSDTTVATATAGSNASNGSLAVTVAAVANTAQASFNDAYGDVTDALAPNTVGTQNVVIDVGTGSDQVTITVPITSATTVAEFVDAVNASSDASGRIAASAVNVGTSASPSYRVVFNTLQQGLDKGQIAFTIPSGAAGFGGATDLQNRTVSQAADASFSLSGISGSITRSSNTISDVVTGVTFNLIKAGSATVSTSDDADSTGDLMAKIVDSFNEIVAYVNDRNTVDRVENGDRVTNVYGALSKTEIDDSFLQQFRDLLSGITADSGTAVQHVSEIGIQTNRDGTLNFDIDAFKQAVADDPLGVSEVLTSIGDQASGVTGLLYEFTKFQGFIDIAVNGNNAEIDNLNEKINQQTRANDKYRAALEGQFARLETITGNLQNQQAALTSTLASLR